MKKRETKKRKRRLPKIGDHVGALSRDGWGVPENDNWKTWRHAVEMWKLFGVV